MLRKQIYLEPQQDEKVKRLAKTLACTEADIIRQAIDRLPDPGHSPEELLRRAGVLAPPPDAADLPPGIVADELEQEIEKWSAGLSRPLGLTAAVLAERR